VTHGAVPIHIYGSVTTTSNDGFVNCFIPGTEIANGSWPMTLEDNYPDNFAFGSTSQLTVDLSSLNLNDCVYINTHLSYGLKGTHNYSKDGNNNAIDATTLLERIPDFQPYTFSSTPGSDVIQSNNSFKRDPGIGGLVTYADTDDPAPGVKVQIFDAKNKLMGTLYTDEDGWFMWQYKYTGKPATFTVVLPDNNLWQSMTLKSNHFILVDFELP